MIQCMYKDYIRFNEYNFYYTTWSFGFTTILFGKK